MKWLMLRGCWDSNNKRNARDKTDVWLQLFEGLVGDGDGVVWYKGKGCNEKYSKNITLTTEKPKKQFDYIFARGAHPYYIPILNRQRGFKIRYGAGRRYYPKEKIKYDLILVDDEKQKEKIDLPNVRLWLKPAPVQWKPVNVRKKYDVCYIANAPQAEMKRIKWVYRTVPKNLKVLHLGIKSSIRPPKNVTRKHVPHKEMPRYISRCKVGIVPYKEIDSAPRALVEMLACGLPVVALNSVMFWKERYPVEVSSKRMFWSFVELASIQGYRECDVSVEAAVEYLRGLIER